MHKSQLKNITVSDKTPYIKGVINEHKQGNANIVAMHGWQDNCASFYPLIDLLPDYNWLAFDFPGHGHSQWRHKDAHYYFVDYIDDIYRVISSNYNEPVYLVGHSMGAMAASLFAACFSELVNAVVLIEGVGMVTTPDEEVVSQLRKAILNREKIYKSENKPKTFKSFESLVKARMAVSDLTFAQCEALMHRNSETTEFGIKLRIDPKLKHHSGFRFNEAQTIMACKQVDVPVKLILGDKGFNKIKSAIKDYSKYYKALSVIEIAGGHHCHMQNPSDTAKIITQFIK